MKLVVDSNILFTFFWKTSVFRKLSLKQELNLVAPEFALEEIRKYQREIIKKSKIDEHEFDDLRRELAIRVSFVPLESYKNYFRQAMSLANEVPTEQRDEFLDDVDFLALAIKEQCPLWTHDALLKKQATITIFETKNIINMLESE